MRIAVVNVAAETSGALSVLNDLYEHIYKFDNMNEWVFYTSVADLKEKDNIKVIKTPWVKKSWFHRIFWEYKFFLELNRKKEFDVVFSLQNKAINYKSGCSIVYFHNMLLLQEELNFSFFKKEERLFFLYDKLISKLTLRSLENADLIITQTETVKNFLKSKIMNNSIEVYPPQIEIGYDVDVKKFKRNSNCFIYPATAQVFKNHEIIVKAINYLVNVENIKDIIVYFTLSGNENDYAKRIFNMSKSLPQIKFIGYLPRQELIKMYYKSTLIQTSKIESYPIPLVEAMSLGAPIVALNYDYINEIIREYNRKYICKKENFKELAHMLIKSMNDEYQNDFNENIKVINEHSINNLIKRITNC